MRIFVTGQQGQVAQSLVARKPDGVELVLAGRPQLDLEDAGSISRAVAETKPDFIFSIAAYTAVDKAEEEPERAMAVNGIAPGVLAQAAKACGAPILHLSTDYVFDGSLDRPYRVDDPVAPLGSYGRSKLAGEQAIAASGADHAIIRTAWVFSPYGANFMKTMLRLGADRPELRVVADQIGCPTSALDIADMLYAMAERWPGQGSGNRLYHFAGSGETSWAGFASAIFAASKGPLPVVHPITTAEYPTPAARPANSRLECSRITADFCITPRRWEDMLAEVIGLYEG